MAKYGFLVVAAMLMLAASISNVSALRCWRCSSDAANAAFCDDPFDHSIVSEQQRRWSYVECSNPPQYSSNNFGQVVAQRPVCKKIKQYVNDKAVVSRSCFWEDINAPRDACLSVSTPSYIRTQFCETCTTDGCNGAAQYGPAALLTVSAVLLAKLLTW